MHPEPKKLGEILVEARLITAAQLQEALRYQRIAGGRMGSNLVSLGFISEDVLMDFLSQQTGVPRMDLRHVEIPVAALEKIPKRLAEQLNILPVALKEPKSLVLAMADPSDLNAIDSARFASGCNIEPVVATYSALKGVLGDQYKKLDILINKPLDPTATGAHADALPVALDIPGLPVVGSPPQRQSQPMPVPVKDYPKDPFFDESAPKPGAPPASFFTVDGPDFFDLGNAQAVAPVGPPPLEQGMVVHDRGSKIPRPPRLEQFHTRTLVLGLIRLLQRRGVLAEDELARLVQTLVDTQEIKDTDSRER